MFSFRQQLMVLDNLPSNFCCLVNEAFTSILLAPGLHKMVVRSLNSINDGKMSPAIMLLTFLAVSTTFSRLAIPQRLKLAQHNTAHTNKPEMTR